MLNKAMDIFTKYCLFESLIVFVLLTQIKMILVGSMDLKQNLVTILRAVKDLDEPTFFFFSFSSFYFASLKQYRCVVWPALIFLWLVCILQGSSQAAWVSLIPVHAKAARLNAISEAVSSLVAREQWRRSAWAKLEFRNCLCNELLMRPQASNLCGVRFLSSSVRLSVVKTLT